jgi:hypothetical protein
MGDILDLATLAAHFSVGHAVLKVFSYRGMLP